MGKLNQGLFQGFIGKTGNIVGKRWKGNYVVSQYQPVVANPKSPKQMIQRDLFRRAVEQVKDFMTGELRATLSGGWTGITLPSSNIGLVAGMLRRKYLSDNGLEADADFFAKPAIMTSGLIDNGNTIFDGLTITQTGTTDVTHLDFDAEAGAKYFGSDIDLSGMHAIIAQLGLPNIYSDVALVTGTELVNTTINKVYGFQDSAEECGNWNFVHKIVIGNIGSSASCEATLIKTKGLAIHQAFYTIGFYVPYGYVISSRFLTKNLTVV